MSMQSFRHTSDEQLFSLLKDGVAEAFTEIFRRYWDKLYIVAANKLDDKYLAQEVVQELFVDIWERRMTIELRKSVNIYLASALKYKVINARLYRNKEQLKRQLLGDDMAGIAELSPEPLRFEELQERLEAVVTGLPEKCQLVYRLSRDEGFTHKQIASQLDISEKTVEQHLTKALKVLRDKFRYFRLLYALRKKIWLATQG